MTNVTGRAGVRRVGPTLALLALGLALASCATPTDGPDRAVLAGSPSGDAGEQPGAGGADEPQIDPGPSGEQTPVGGRPWDAGATEACAAELGEGFTEVAQSTDPSGVTTFWTRGRRDWVVCDVPAGLADAPVVIGSTPAARRGFGARALALHRAPVTGDETGGVRFVAGGLLPWRVDELSYLFPDGVEQQARFVASEDDPDQVWWVVTHTPTDGVLVDPGTDPADLEPVTISIVGAAAEAFRLPWAELQRTE
jgi:hypothetical protein